MERAPELQSLPVRVTSLQQGVEVLDYQPTTVAVALDRLAERQVPVEVETGELPEGLVNQRPRTSHEEVTASGPESQLGRVDRAVAGSRSSPRASTCASRRCRWCRSTSTDARWNRWS